MQIRQRNKMRDHCLVISKEIMSMTTKRAMTEEMRSTARRKRMLTTGTTSSTTALVVTPLLILLLSVVLPPSGVSAAAAPPSPLISHSSSNSAASLASASASASAFVPPAGFGPTGPIAATTNAVLRKTAIRTELLAYIDGHDRASSLPPSSSLSHLPSSPAATSATAVAATTTAPPTHRPSRPVETLPNGGRITLVGSGPGDPSLLTVAAHTLLSDANCLVIVDRLVSDEIRSLIKGQVRVANKHPGCQHEAQDEIYAWVKEGVEMGRHVVRLKIGDPFVFGRGGEEVLEFRNTLGIEPKVIPGVSAAFSAPLLGSIPVTHRGVANQVVLCTGYGRDNTSPDLIRYHPEQTVVFLMAVGRLYELSRKLVEMANFPCDTPVGIIEKAGCPGQRTIVGTLDTIGDIAERYNVKPPSTIVVGEVVGVLLRNDEDEDESRGTVFGLIRDAKAEAEFA